METTDMPVAGHPVYAMLKRRGYEAILYNPVRGLFFPPGTDKSIQDEVYELLKKYSFRILIRDIIKNREDFGPENLLKYSTLKWVSGCIEFLGAKGIIRETAPGRYRLQAEPVSSFGDTLEWFVACVLEKEFLCPSLWGVRLRGGTVEGDFDVISSLEGELVYIEAKSSPPKNIEEEEVAAFMKRVLALSPAMAIFLEDTRLRMHDKIVPIFHKLLESKKLEISRLMEETFSIQDRIFITNSGPDIIGSIGACIRRYLTRKGFR